jgi:hypothetical protein
MTLKSSRILAIVLLLVGPWTTSASPSGPAISLSSAALSFAAFEGGALPADQTLTLRNSGGGHLDWNVSADRPWLTVTPASGHLNEGQSIGLAVHVNAQVQAEGWAPISSANAPGAREDHDAAWTGSRMVVWGGEIGGSLLNTGGLYDPVTNSWTGATSLVNAPSPRTLHTMTWTGQQVIVWGGSTGASTGDTYYNQGYKYNPATNQWQGTVSTAGAPSARSFHTAVWTGSRMIIWGGYDGSQRVNTGGLYDPSKNKWVGSTGTVGAPSPRLHHVAAWTGTEMIIWGGDDGAGNLNDGARYNPETNTWTPMTMTNAPTARQAATAIWDGWEMVLWGGNVGAGLSTDGGARYNPVTDTWAAETSLVNALTPRQGHSAVWTGSKMIVSHGAFAGGPFYDDGAIYTPPVLPRGTHPATITVTAMGGLNKSAPVTLTVTPAPAPQLRITGALPAPGSSLPGASDSILLTLNEDFNASSVTSSSVKLLRAGPDGLFGTADDVVLNPALSIVGTNQIRVSLTGIPVLSQPVRLVVSGTPAAFAGRFGHWRLDEGSGSSTADASGNGRVGLLDNVTWTAGRVGYGLHFDGGANRVNIDAGTIAPSWSAAMWIRREDSPNAEARILDPQETDTFGTSLRLEQFNPADRVGFTTLNVEDYFFDYIAPVNAWVHLTFVGTATGTSLYADGALIGTHPASVSLFVAKLGSFSTNAMKGTLDEVQIYSRALTAAEILSLARLDGAVKGTSGRVLDGEYSGSFPSGNGVSGGNFQATWTR